MEHAEEFRIPEEGMERLKDPEMIRQFLQEGRTLQDIIGYTHETMEKFYQSAYKMFSQRRFKEAGEAFLFLTTINPYVYPYWLGLGMCHQWQEEFEEALLAYSMAILTDTENHPQPHYHSATCYCLLNDKNSATIALNMTIEKCQGQKEYAEIFEKAKNALSKMEG